MYVPVPAHEHLRIDTYAELCKGLPNVRCMSTEGVHDFFRRCDAGEVGPCVLVSAGCDYSVREQAEHHPNADLLAHAFSVDYDELAADRSAYRAVQVGPACVPEKCHPRHRYAARTDRHTWFTFADVPRNVVRWYTTNLDVDHPRMRWLPFGLNNDGPGSDLLPSFAGREKKGLLYVNFANNSLERARLKRHFSRQPWVTFRDQANLPVEQYLAEVAEHKFVLAPFGCGLDCYRTYEAIYLGAVPVLPESRFATHARRAGLPVATVQPDDFYRLTPEQLAEFHPQFWADEYDCRPLTRSFWKTQFSCLSESLPSA